jgi:hypothetical protein
MASQASSVLCFSPDQDWSNIDPSLHPSTSSLAASTPANADPDANADATIDGKVTHKRTSEVWDHSFYSRHRITLNKKGQSIWRCKYCSKTYIDTGGTGNAKAHLLKHHGHQIQSQNEKRIKGYQGKIDMAEFRALADTANHKRRRLDGSTIDDDNDGRGLGCDLDAAVLEQLYVAWITTCGVAFEMVEKQEFRA